ncbi:hypothetical protein B0T16DRAFT_499418 [Cercophora newfieldiana]|uniref:Uncharacterized protein n=1 Tax=Cercophora newfieldiana TaxID=92897 RepID=A0AA40CXX3_9PEZI|nr:hypothetical protein B0T16DRAFT_499418 [Cercophora newfieldiana]
MPRGLPGWGGMPFSRPSTSTGAYPSALGNKTCEVLTAQGWHPLTVNMIDSCMNDQQVQFGWAPDKTELLYIPPQGRGSRKRTITRPRIGTPAGVVMANKTLKWLGVTLDSKFSVYTHVKARVVTTARITSLAARVNQVSRGVPPRAARDLFITGVLPTLLYGFSLP